MRPKELIDVREEILSISSTQNSLDSNNLQPLLSRGQDLIFKGTKYCESESLAARLCVFLCVCVLVNAYKPVIINALRSIERCPNFAYFFTIQYFPNNCMLLLQHKMYLFVEDWVFTGLILSS